MKGPATAMQERGLNITTDRLNSLLIRLKDFDERLEKQNSRLIGSLSELKGKEPEAKPAPDGVVGIVNDHLVFIESRLQAIKNMCEGVCLRTVYVFFCTYISPHVFYIIIIIIIVVG